MKKVLSAIPIVVGIIMVIIFVGNSMFRVISIESGNEHGIFEEIIFGRSIVSFLQPQYSENFKKWENAIDGSAKIANTLNKYGTALTEDEKLDSIRKETLQTSQSAYQDAKEIDLEYLKESNEQLPEMFSEKLTKALRLWSEGLASKDITIIVEGNENYNEFLEWTQTTDRDDFKELH